MKKLIRWIKREWILWHIVQYASTIKFFKKGYTGSKFKEWEDKLLNLK